MNIKKVIIWGYKLHSHTHSYIHHGFYKAFKSMGYDTYWFTDIDDVSGFNFENCLFITASDQEKNIPIRKDCYYVLHNVNSEKYINSSCNILTLQVNTSDSIKRVKDGDIIFNNYSFLSKGEIDCLYTCWATDLLPDEIDISNAKNIVSGDKYCLWAGTYGDNTSTFQNGTELEPFFRECEKNGIILKLINPWASPISFEDNSRLVNESYISPTIQGPWQIENRYIPCRIFKNISYGHYGYTNSEAVNDIFEGSLIYDRDPVNLFNKIIEKKNDPNHINELKFLMNEVKEKHTYINRIKLIIECLP